MKPQDENLKFGYSFAHFIRCIAHAVLLIGVCCILVFVGIGLYDSILAKYSHEEDKVALDVALKIGLEKADKSLAELKKHGKDARENAERECAREIQRLEDQYKADEASYNAARKAFNEALSSKLKELEKEAALALAQLGKIEEADTSSLKPIKIKKPNIKLPSDAQAFKTELDEVESTLGTYQEFVKQTVIKQFDELKKPVDEKLLELHKSISGFERLIKGKEDKIAEIRNRHQGESRTEYEEVEREVNASVQPVPNIYGITEPNNMHELKNVADNMAQCSAGIPKDDPIAQDSVTRSRIAINRIKNWLPHTESAGKEKVRVPKVVQTPPTPLTDEEMQEIENLKAEIRSFEEKLQPLREEVGKLNSTLAQIEQSREWMNALLTEACENWKVHDLLMQTETFVDQYQATPPAPIDEDVRKVKERKDKFIENSLLAESVAERATAVLKRELEAYTANMKIFYSNAERCMSNRIMADALMYAGKQLVVTWLAFYLLMVLADYVLLPIIGGLHRLEKLKD